ncbi:MAG: PAS domain S-box protein [Planctomycetes bacterium]|nr:PAS domain S-box protein [Planctomycetota bacterium]
MSAEGNRSLFVMACASMAATSLAVPLAAYYERWPNLPVIGSAVGLAAVAIGASGLLLAVLHLAGTALAGVNGLGPAVSVVLVLLGSSLALQGQAAATGMPRTGLAAIPALAAGVAASLALFLGALHQDEMATQEYAKTRALEGVDAVNRRIDVTESALLRIALMMSEQRGVEQTEWSAVVDESRSDLPGLVQCDIESNGRRSRSPAQGPHSGLGDAAWAGAFGPDMPRRRVHAGLLRMEDAAFLYFATFANGSTDHRVRVVAVFQLAQFLSAALPRHIADGYTCRFLSRGELAYESQDLGGSAPWGSFTVGAGDVWSLQLRPSPAFLRSHRSSTPLTVLFAGGLVSALAGYSSYRAAQSRRRAVELRKSNLELEDSRSSLEQLIASLPEAVLVVAADGTIERVGGTPLSVLTRQGSSLVGRSVDEFIGLDEGGLKLRDTRKVSGMEGLVGQRVDAVVRGENGQTNYCVIRISALDTAQGRRYLWSVADIQWRKTVEEERTRLIEELRKQIEANRELASRHSALVNCGAIGMGLVDPEGRFLEFNQTFAQTVGYSREELLAMSLKDLNHPDDQPQAANFLAEMQQGKREGYQTLKRYRRKDGAVVWVDVTGAALRDENGELRGIIGIMLDVSVRVAAAKALEASEQKLQHLNEQQEARNRELQAILEESRESAERFRTLLASAPEATILVNPDGRILEFNKRAQELLGYTEEEARASTVEMLVPPEVRPRHEGIRKEYMLAPEHRMMARGRDLVAMAKDGSRIPVEINLSPLRFRGQVYVAASMVDLRERLRVADELRSSERRLRAANKELESIVYVASHDMRSPLVNLQGFSRQLSNAADKLVPLTAKLPPEERTRADALLTQDIPEAVGFIAASTRKMDALIKGLLRLSRLGRAPLQMRSVDMNHLISETVSATQFLLTERGMQVELGDLPACWGDETQLGQVFSNLVDNAIKYRDQGRPGIIRIRGRVVDDYAVYEVEDNGIGIAPDHQGHIFEVFHRLAPDGEVPGEGLGLSVVRRIIDRHEGDVRVRSTPGVGSQFTVILPRRPGARAASEVENGQPN